MSVGHHFWDDIRPYILGSIIPVSIFVFLFTRHAPKHKPVVAKECAQLIYLNQDRQIMDTAFTTALVYDSDSLVNFKSPNGQTWRGKTIVEQSQIWNDDDKEYYFDVTVSDGEHFKITTIDSGLCKMK
jgi:hypothetical protein